MISQSMDQKSDKVYGVRCSAYEDAGEALRGLLDMMGGVGRFVSPGERLALKANLLLAATPDAAATTHPEIVKAAAVAAVECGARPVIVDSPGSGYRYDRKRLEKTYLRTGMKQAAEESGAELNFDCTHRVVSFPKGRMIKRFEIITPIRTADVVFNLCKLKTHMFTYMTGAVKNCFGVIPGLLKPGYHAKLRDTGRFASMLLDLTELVDARLHVMDAVYAMEGEGPQSGSPRRAGFILASANPVALDAVAGEIIGLDAKLNPVLVEAGNRNIGPCRLEDVDLIGLSADELRVPGFKRPSTYHQGRGLGRLNLFHRLVSPYFKDAMSVRPFIDTEKCRACGSCVRACPAGAIALNAERRAVIDDDKCIRCYCCHEMCEEKAVELRKGLLYRILRPAA